MSYGIAQRTSLPTTIRRVNKIGQSCVEKWLDQAARRRDFIFWPRPSGLRHMIQARLPATVLTHCPQMRGQDSTSDFLAADSFVEKTTAHRISRVICQNAARTILHTAIDGWHVNAVQAASGPSFPPISRALNIIPMPGGIRIVKNANLITRIGKPEMRV